MGNREEVLVRRFAAADLRAVVTESVPRRRPVVQLGFTSSDIFQMGIRGSGKTEHFTVSPGAEDNRVEVQNIDEDLRQLVLMVHEPVRKFTQGPLRKGPKFVRSEVEDIVRENESHYWIERKTPDAKRHFLCGTDERHYFICQLPRPVSTVKRAHEVLKPEDAREKSKKGEVIRQGEWFFLEPSRADRELLEGLEKTGKLVKYLKMPIGPAYQGVLNRRQGFGHPHTADELVLLRGDLTRQPALFVRGKVRHAEHETREFYSWVKVVRNTEPLQDGAARMNGVTWFD